MKLVHFINFCLVVLIIFILVYTLAHENILTGQITDNLAKPSNQELKEQSSCQFVNQGAEYTIPIENCCYEISLQLRCETIGDDKFDLKCYNAYSTDKYYQLNKEAFDYCYDEGYDVKVS